MNTNILSNQTFPEIEKEVSQFWKENTIFEKIQSQTDRNLYRFVDGPPFPNDIPHYGHLLCSIAKDVIPRYRTMKGDFVRRVFGWDCHGLAIEEKLNDKLGIKGSDSKEKIENEIGVKNYIKMCRELVGTNIDAWKYYMEKIGRWSDMDNAYKTMDQKFGESVVWSFKQLWEKGLIYKGRRTSLYSTDSSTPVSDFEVNMDPDNYRETEDVSVYMAFKLKDSKKLLSTITSDIYVLSWTTTPWTLYANSALALNKEEDYTLVRLSDGRMVIVAEKLIGNLQKTVPTVFEGLKSEKSFKGEELIGLEYEQYINELKSESENDFKIYHGDFVSMEDGTGIVHIAPAYGEDDAKLGVTHKLTNFESIDSTGHMLVGSFKGKYLRDANLEIAKELLQMQKVLKIKAYKHRLPYYRTSNPLIYMTQEAWFIDIQKLKPRMLELLSTSNWVPETIRDGRWKNTIESSPDWCISRNRYWNTIMPMWVASDGDIWVVGSIQEIQENCKDQNITKEDSIYFITDENGEKQEFSMHRDVCDEIILVKNSKEYRRVPYVLDNWMDAGSVPFAEYHYPFENKEVFRDKPSADFIVEYVGQVRAWFNVLFRMSVGVFGEHAFDNVICTGVLAGNDGRKMSKSLKNYPDSKEMLENVGGDAVRLFLMNSPLLLGGDAECHESKIREQVKVILLPLVNSIKYFELYATEFKYDKSVVSNSILDKWIMVRIHELVSEVDQNLLSYDIPSSVKSYSDFVTELSTIYIKMSRNRFVAKDTSALNTLYKVLKTLAIVGAPFVPFISEKAYQVLSKYEAGYKLSVHEEEFPIYSEISDAETNVKIEMDIVTDCLNQIFHLREKSAMPVKQVLASATVNGYALTEEMKELIADQANLRNVINNPTVDKEILLDTTLNDELKSEG